MNESNLNNTFSFLIPVLSHPPQYLDATFKGYANFSIHLNDEVTLAIPPFHDIDGGDASASFTDSFVTAISN